MRLFEYVDKLSIFDKLVRQERTGTPGELAERLSIGRSTLYEMIDELRSRGAEIKYSRPKGTFYYYNDVVLDIRLNIKLLTDNDKHEELKNFSH